MAKFALLLFTAAFCASVQSAPSLSDSLEEELNKLALDAVKENTLAKAQLDLVLWVAESSAAAKKPEKKECLEKVKGPAIIDELCLLADTTGAVMAAVAEAKATSEGRDPKEVLAELDYDNRKQNAVNKLKGKVVGWIAELEKSFNSCVE